MADITDEAIEALLNARSRLVQGYTGTDSERAQLADNLRQLEVIPIGRSRMVDLIVGRSSAPAAPVAREPERVEPSRPIVRSYDPDDEHKPPPHTAARKGKRIALIDGHDPDGRYTSQYAVDSCVCAYCWGALSQVWDEDDQRWYARCTADESHIGYHHKVFRAKEIERHTVSALDIKEFYRQTEYAKGFGLTPRLEGQALQDRFAAMRRVMRDATIGE